MNDKSTGTPAFTGTSLDGDLLRRRINELTEPRLLVDVEAVEIDGKRMLIVQVPEGIEVHATKKGQASRRLGTDCLPMRPADIARLSYERRGIDWTSGTARRDNREVSPLALASLITAMRFLCN